MKVRAATIMDLTRLMVFCKNHEHLLADAGPPLNTGYLRKQLNQAIKANDEAIFITVDEGQKVLGLIVCWIAPYIWSRQLYVTDILFVADSGGDVLMKKMEQWGRANGACCAAMQTHLGFDRRVEKLYARKGFKKVGFVFEKPIGLEQKIQEISL